MDRKEEAIKSFGEAIRRSPEWMWPYNDRGEIYLDSGEYDLAIVDFNQAIRYSPNFAMGWNNRCRAFAAIGQLEAALRDCDKAIKIKPTFVNHMVVSGDVSGYQDRALVHLKAGRFHEAIADYNDALGLTPGNSEALYGRGLAKLKNGDSAGGESDIASAKSINSKITDTFARLGVK